MLRITIPNTGESQLTFTKFEQYELPAPPDGVDAEINGDLILKFDDEQEAITYADQLENMANELKDKSTPEYIAVSDIIITIRNDEFIKAYNQ